MSRLKEIGVWMMIALWLSSGLIAHPYRLPLVPSDSGHSSLFLPNEAGLNEASTPAILPVQQVRTSGARLTGPATDGPPFHFVRARTVLIPCPSLPSAAPGLKRAALAQTWQFLQRTASYPRSPSSA